MAWGQSFAVMLAVLLLAGSVSYSNAELCGVDSNDPENMECTGADPMGSRSWFSTTDDVEVKEGLSYDFYQNTCPSIKTVIQTMVKDAVKQTKTHIPGLIRLLFHDCFIQGCDGSVLLNTSTNGEQAGRPNLTLRQESLILVNKIKAKLEQLCPHIVSCADIVAGAAAAVVKVGKGPEFRVPYGRRDSTTFQTADFVTKNLPSPFSTAAQNLAIFQGFGLDVQDLVTLSGGHTVGQAHCGAFAGRLRPTVSNDLDTEFANRLKAVCPDTSSNNVVFLDRVSPFVVDNHFYQRAVANEAVLASDASLESDADTIGWVKKYANDEELFHKEFEKAMIKMSQINVLTGKSGQIRTICGEVNSA